MSHMPESWNQWEGLTTGGYVLGRRLDAAEDTAYFEAESDSGGAIVRLAAGDGAAAQLELWKRIAGMSHPGVLRLLDAGWAEEGAVAYAVLERPDENLGEVLGERPLRAEEAGPALLATAEALAYVHERGFVHGEVGPWSVVAVGDTIKIPSDGLRPRSDAFSAAGDVRALGLTACEMLTRRVPVVSGGEPQLNSGELAAIEPFEKFIRNCLREEDSRWTAARAAAFLKDPRAEEKHVRPVAAEMARPAAAPQARPAAAPPAHHDPAPSPEPVARETPRRRTLPRWTYGAAAALALAGALFLGARNSRHEPAAPATSPQPPPAAAAPAAPAPAQRPAAAKTAPAKEAPSAARAWRVIAFTYNGLGPAEKKARSINKKWPQFKAEVFAPEPHRGPYLISLNGRMTREEAVRVQRTARAKGLPRDTFIRNYVR